MLSKINQDLMILEILTLSRPQKTLKQRDALFKKHCRGKPKMWLDNLLLVLTVLHIQLGDLLNQPSKEKLRTECYSGNIYGGPSRLMIRIPKTYKRDPQGFWKCYVSRNTANLAWQRKKENETRESYWTTKILQARNRLIKLLSCEHVLSFEKLR